MPQFGQPTEVGKVGWDATYVLLSLCFVLIAIKAFTMLLRLRRVVGRSTTQQQVFSGLLIIGCLLHASCLIVILSNPHMIARLPVVVLLDLSEKIFVTVFLTLALFWVKIYYKGENDEINLRRATVVYYLGNLFLYTTVCIFYGIALSNPIKSHAYNIAIESLISIDASFYIIVSFVFVWFVAGVLRQLKAIPLDGMSNKERNETMTRVKMLIVTVGGFSFVRGVVILVANWSMFWMLEIFWLNLLYYLLLDLLPIMLTLWVLQGFGMDSATKSFSDAPYSASAPLI